MAQAANTFVDDEPVERQPGQFRRSKTGTPYVVDPTGAVTKKGTPKLMAYGRPSGFGKQIEDTYNLAKWSERTVALGLGIDYSLACQAMAQPELAAACATLVELDRDSTEFRSAADAIVVEAKRVAKAGLAAERGTQGHALTEEVDEGRDPIALYADGEALGLDADVQRSLVDAWQQMLERDGLEILLTEFAVVHDGYRQAGTSDRLARLTRPLRFALVTGEIVELDTGTVVVLDIKTGRLRRDRNDVPMYWQAYSVQIATYAGGVLYDPDNDTRTPYPWPVDQHWALIAHLDVLGAIAGQPSCELVLVDIEAGRAAADLCLAAKAWEKRSDVFSVSQLDSEIGGDEPCEVCLVAHDGPCVDIATPVVAPTNAELHARLRRHPDIDEGTVDDQPGLDAVFAKMAEHFLALPNTAKAWAANLQVQAQQNAAGFHARERHTLRRFEIIRGLIVLAVSELDDDELIRYLVQHVTGDDVAQFPVITPGHALGSLDADEARAFALACDQLAADQIVLTFTEAGEPQFVARRAA